MNDNVNAITRRSGTTTRTRFLFASGTKEIRCGSLCLMRIVTVLFERPSKVRERSVCSDLISRLVLLMKWYRALSQWGAGIWWASLRQKSGWEKTCLMHGPEREMSSWKMEASKSGMRKIYDWQQCDCSALFACFAREVAWVNLFPRRISLLSRRFCQQPSLT